MKALFLIDASDVLVPRTTVYLQMGNELCRCTIKSLRKTNRGCILSCSEIADRNRASLFRGATVLVPSGLVPRSEEEYLREEIIGLTVVTTSGEEIGDIVDIIDTPAHDIYVVASRGKEYLVPAVRAFIVDILLDKGKVFVKEIEGLFD
jgi:16S rRNA processing protein RimM